MGNSIGAGESAGLLTILLTARCALRFGELAEARRREIDRERHAVVAG
ncbi:MAG: hypothetical protein J2P20_17810 [Pseudonocardia sp.]|nr:hypothetical protein [Pseudonocardia sp.]MBO0875283.1 hypothetical protein [Pseudonocardia sp.]